MIRKRGESWVVDFRHGGDRVRRGGFGTEHEALAWEASAKLRLSRGEPLEDAVAPVADSWTLGKLIDAVDARYWTGRANGGEARRLADNAAKFFGEDAHPSTITSERIDAWVKQLREEKNKSGTINRKLSALGRCLRHAASRGIVDKVPHLDREKESEGRVRWYTREEEAKILGFIQDPLVRDFVVFLLDTGGRLGESLAVQVRDCGDAQVLFSKTKNGKLRSVPLTTRLRGIIRARKDALAGASPTSLLWAPLGARDVRAAWNDARAQAGLSKDPQAVIHACRHTCASRLVQAGVSIQVVKEWLGHGSLTMTLRYAHLAPANIEAAVAALDRAVA
jgi:integrase